MMDFRTFVGLASVRYPELKFGNFHSHPQVVPFYGEFYELTFGEQDVQHRNELADLVKKYGAKNSLECFGGSAFESALLKKDTGIRTVSLDIVDGYYDKDPSVEYRLGDCFNPHFTGEIFDLIFVGSTNASMESVLNENELDRFMAFIDKNIAKDGVFVASFFPASRPEDEEGWDSWRLTHTENIISFHPRWMGYKTEWWEITHENFLKGIHTYYGLLKLTEPGTGIETWWYCEEGHVSKCWSFYEVRNAASKVGLKLLEEDYFFDSRFVPFRKVV